MQKNADRKNSEHRHFSRNEKTSQNELYLKNSHLVNPMRRPRLYAICAIPVFFCTSAEEGVLHKNPCELLQPVTTGKYGTQEVGV